MSQVSIINIQGQYPQIPTQFNANAGFAIPIANQIDIYATYVPAGLNPARTVAAGKTIQVEVQLTQAAAASDVLKAGLASFDEDFFSVDAAGFVTFDGPVGADLTITGNGGPAISPVLDNWNFNTANATVTFSGAAIDASQKLDFGITNLLLGSLGAITSGDRNVGLGMNAMAAIADGNRNVALGYNSALVLNSHVQTVAVGSNSLSSLNAGIGRNTAIGAISLFSLVGGERNLALGYGSGQNYTSNESDNIILAADGLFGESGVIRIGTLGTQVAALMQGIYSVAAEAASEVVVVGPSGLLATAGVGAAGTVLTSNGAGATPTWQPGGGGGAAITYTGNTGGALAPPVNLNVVTASSTFVVAGAGSTLTLDFSNANSNFAIGTTMPARTTGTQNYIYGDNGAGNAITSGSNNVISGGFAGAALTTGTQNVFLGSSAARNSAVIGRSVAVGNNALVNFTASSAPGFDQNTAVGNSSLSSLTTGRQNIALGTNAGSSYTTSESFNISIGNSGTVGESNVTRIGSSQTAIYLSGSTAAALANSGVLLVDNNTRLSSAGQGSVGQVLTSNGAGVTPTWQPAGGGGTPTALTPNTGGIVNPVAGNINVFGLPILGTQSVPLQTQTYNDSGNLRIKAPNCCLFIVDADALYGTHTTIQSAIDDATLIGTPQYVFIRPGTYVGNLTLKTNVSLANFSCAQNAPVVKISGNITVQTNVNSSITGIQLNNTGGALITMASSPSTLTLLNCCVFPQGATGFSIGSGCSLILEACIGNMLATGIAYFAVTSGAISFTDCTMYNTVGSVTQNTVSAGSVIFVTSTFQAPITSSGTCALGWSYSQFECGSGMNVTCYNAGANVTSQTDIIFCEFTSGTATAIICASGNVTLLQSCIISSSNAAAISGAGTIRYTPITFSGTSAGVTTTTQTAIGAIGPRLPVGSLGLHILSGAGSPNGVVTAPQGSLYLNSTGSSTTTRMFVNTNSGTAWTSVTTAT
jgi:hypothetical protein